MLNKLLLLCCLLTVVFTSCQKDIANTTINALNTSAGLTGSSTLTGVLDTTSKWYGTYTGYFKTYPVMTEELLIKDGVAQLPYLDRQFSYSFIYYDIPPQRSISGDSIQFEAKLKNTKATSFSNYDVVMQLVGEQHTAEVHFVADDLYREYNSYYVGVAKRENVKELVHYFGTFRTLKLAQKKYYTAVYINDTEVYKFKYGEKNSIGKLKTIGIGFKGYGTCTEAGIRSSFGSKPIFSENFNTDGKSNVLYYF